MNPSRPVRVCHISTVHPTFDQRIFHRECCTLADAGFKVSLVAHSDSSLTKDNVEVVSLGKANPKHARLRLLDRFADSRQALNTALKLQADIYQFHDPELIFAGVELKRRTRARVIYDCHEDNVGYALQKRYLSRPLRRILATGVGLAERFAARFLDAVVTADEGVNQRFVSFGANAHVIYNFPRLELFPEVVHPGEPTFDLVYHGSVPRYHLEVCFAVDDELVRRGYHLRWLFFGRIDDPNWATEQISARNAADRIVIEGLIPHEHVSEKVRTARMGIIPLPNLPKFQHNIPTKLFEFMALKMPVVLSDLPPTRPFLKAGNFAVSVPPDDINAYCDAIIRLVNAPALCEQMGCEGRRLVEQEYNWQTQGEKLIALYHSLLETSR